MDGEASSSSSKKKRVVPNDYGFIDTIFSWSLEDIFNENLFKGKVEQIPVSFQSVTRYFESFVFPLLEETRAQLCSSLKKISEAPFAQVVAFEDSKPNGAMLYDVKVNYWRNRFSNRGKEPYKLLPGDILVLANAKPETDSDLQRAGRMWTFVSVTKLTEDESGSDTTSTSFKVKASKENQIDGAHKSLFAIFLTNVTSNRRIWNSVHMSGNFNIIKELLCTDSVVDEDCELCPVQSDGIPNVIFGPSESSALNDSQAKAVLSCLHRIHCDHKATVELIWGPPGTGKTKTVSMLVASLLQMKCRTLICTPTNVAIMEVASRVVKLVKESVERISSCTLFFPLGEILLFGNNERLKANSGVEEIYLDYRIERLAECFAPGTGWRPCFNSMIYLLEDCVSEYHIFLGNESMKQSKDFNGNEIKGEECWKDTEVSKGEIKTFLQFVRERFKCTAAPLRSCIFKFGTHIPRSYIGEDNFQVLGTLLSLLDSFETLLFQDNMGSEDLEELFSHSVDEDFSRSIVETKYMLHQRRSKCLSVLRHLWSSFNGLDLPSAMNIGLLKDFCFTKASLIFCTVSSSYKLHSVVMERLKFLVIDEAAQLKESESTIPLQLPGIQHAILIGDECQLPAMVESSVSSEACFGRSLFERLSHLGHTKHLLSIQYRMHPSISFFPNSYFYGNKICDSTNVKKRSYEKRFLPGRMYGPYSFINVLNGREESIDDSRRNMVEVSVAMKILLNLYKAWIDSKEKLSIGIVSPYSAQVVAIQEKLGSKYENSTGFAVKVMSIDGFQGGEEDIIIISTVRSSNDGSIGFISNPKRVNVALTRARHCLWILGNERTLTRNKSVWKALVHDAKARQCFFNADDEEDLGKAILDVKKELDELDELLNPESILFRSQRWKVNFSDNFLKSFRKLSSDQTKKLVINLLLKLSSGWRPKKRNVDSVCENTLHIIKQFKVEGFYIICTIDIVKESQYSQVLKVWDILPLEDIPKLVARLNTIFVKYTDEFINRCQEKCIEGKLEVPKTWAATSNVVRFKNVADNDNDSGSDLSGAASDGRSYVEYSNVSDSLLLMKFYSLSSSVVSHLLSDRDGRELDLPFEVTDEQLEMILFPRSTFIIGRSGTGKTTILTMKLFQKEKLHHMAMEGFYGVNTSVTLHSSWETEAEEGPGETERPILRQLFVTVSPKLCFAVKQHISEMKSSAFGGKFVVESSLVDIDDATEFKDIPNSFVDIPAKSYPLVITFHKFLMMLDGTLGNSYFERFHDIRKHYGQVQNSSLLFLQTFIRTKEVSYERFCSSYWPHFSTQLTKKLDPSRVFTEIISHIKGGLQSIEVVDGKLCREEYIRISETRVSTLVRSEREKIYEIYENYEQMKMRNGEFDLADLVNDLHHRYKEERYKGDGFHFVYIDEVQDLTMSQIALFKYVCRNIEEGFVFSGDTAQTIARGIDFRFEDIRSLFYKKFVMESRNTGNVGRQQKGQLSDIFNLSQNFRTHVGVLNLAQSVIELLYRSFPHSVDILKPETSLIYGDPPVLLESGNDENAIIKIFGNSGDVGGNMVGFGAEQVILVRDDRVRKEISNYVGRQALVLTIVESKGLEFQDVLLYDFFGSSPLKSQWRVVYEYMKEQALLDSTLLGSFPSFNEAKHNVLCSELKQLYVAITRTRQRLWIWENMEEFSKPMFDYWRQRLLVQVRQLDDSLAQAMQVASSPEEWKSRGIKLFFENNYEMATICFEKAKDSYWEGMSKATSLKATADRLRSSNPFQANVTLREAAKIFEAIGKADSAAKCFYDLGEYTRAGWIYLERCEKPELKNAGECFFLAGCYKFAADVYARGNFFSECLAVCSKGKLFDIGLQYINNWEQHADTDVGLVGRSKEIYEAKQDFLQSCAHHYHGLKNFKLAADVYARGKFFSECLAVCSEGKLFGIGLQYINYWKQHAETDVGLDRRSKEMIKIEKDFLRSCALHYRGLKDYKLAADMYARGKFFSECLAVCFEGKLIDIGLQYINNWKQHADRDVDLLVRSIEMNKIEKDFLRSCALHYHGLKEYKPAADMYARGKFFSECLAVCLEGKLIDIGLEYINYWKQHADTDVGIVGRREEIYKTEQDFLQSCARHYHGLKDKKSMMKFVKSFHSMDLMREFLKSLSCYDELLVLEEESGNFMDAANIARLRGDIFLAADLLKKAGNFKEACNVTLNHVLSNSLWSPGSEGWPLKQFKQKKEILEKVKSLAKNESNQFYEFVCTEADILSNDQSDLSIINQQLNASKRHQSISGEILSVRKILDFHLKADSSKFVWADESVFDLVTYSEETICKNRVSVQTLIYFWDCWKDKIVNVIKYLGRLKSQDFNDNDSYGDFCLNYLGVWKQYDNLNTIYILLNGDADWVSNLDNRHAPRIGKLASIDVHQLVSAGRSYWSSELLSVGMKVMDNLEALHKQLSKNSPTVFSQVQHLTYIYEVAKFLLSSEYLNLRLYDAKILQKFVDLSTEHFHDFIFPVDWRESLKMNMITLRGTESYRSIIKEVIFKQIGLKGIPSYGQIGTAVVMILGSGKLGNDVYERVAKRLDEKSPWKEFVESLSWNTGLESCQESASYHNSDKGESHIWKFYGALVDIYEANWRRVDYITPASFLNLIERLLILLSSLNGYIFTTKSSFVDWLIFQEGSTNPTCSSSNDVRQSIGGVLKFIVTIVRQFLYNDKEMMEWIASSHTNIKHYHSLVVLRLVVIICLLHLNFGGDSLNLLLDLLSRSYICNKLPREFYDTLRRRRNGDLLNVIAAAFKKIGNPLVLALLVDSCPKFACPDAIFVDMVTKRKDMVTKSKDDILRILFPVIEASEGHAGAAKKKATNLQREVLSPDCQEQGKGSNVSSSNSVSVPDQEISTLKVNAGDLPVNLEQFWKILEALEFEDQGIGTKTVEFKSSTIKEYVKKCIQLLSAALDGCFQKNSSHGEDKSRWDEAASMLDDLKQLDGVMSEWKHEHLSTLGEIYERLQSSRPKLEPFLNQLFQQRTIGKGSSSETEVASAGKFDVENTDSNADECSGSDEEKTIPTSSTSAVGSPGSSQKPEGKRAGTSKSKNNRKKIGGKKNK